MKNRIITAAFPFLVFPLLTGAETDEMVHSDSEIAFKYVNDAELANTIYLKYGYYVETETPTLTAGDESHWRFNAAFYRATEAKIQMRLYYVYGNVPAFPSLNNNGCKYWQVYSSPLWSGLRNTLFSFSCSLSSLFEDHGIKYDSDRYNVFTASFIVGIYVDEHEGNYKGKFYYIDVPTTYNTGKRYHLNVGDASNYNLYNTDMNNQKEFHRRSWFGGKEWKTKIDSIYGGTFDDWWDFKTENRGECNAPYFTLPLKMRLTQFGNPNYRNLMVCKQTELSLFIYDGYEKYKFGKTSVGYDGKVGYKIPLKQSFDGVYVTFVPDTLFYASLDGRRIYIPQTVPSGGNEDFYIIRNGIPLPAIEEKTPTKFLFQIELLNVGALGLVDITAKFSYTKSKNAFGSNKTSSYYVEEEL